MNGRGDDALSAREQKILADKRANFKGSCKFFIKRLAFPYPSRPVDKKIIKQLQRL
jgi:hypothetical protein